jgi:hypothetical protein
MSKRARDSGYDTDFYAWANEQAALLRAGKLAEADLPHIAEEIESMGKAEKRELVSQPHSPAASSPQVALPAGVAQHELASQHRRATLASRQSS